MRRLWDIIERCYGHDDDGDRDDSEPERSAADIVDELCAAEIPLMAEHYGILVALRNIKSTIDGTQPSDTKGATAALQTLIDELQGNRKYRGVAL